MADLCTLAHVRSFLQKPAGDTNQDALIAQLITRASSAIEHYCQREFGNTGSATRIFYYGGGHLLDLTPYDLRSATLVQLDTDTTTPLTATTTDYILGPTPSIDGTYQFLRLPTYTTTDRPGKWSSRQVQITGTWGFASVPADVEQAAVVTVAIWLRRDVAAFSTTFSVDEQRLERPEGLPSSVRSLLNYWRRIPVG